MLPVDPKFERVNDAHTTKQRLNIHDIQIEDPFTMKTKNDFIDSPPFGLYDIFNHLIYHATDYDKQGLAAYKSFEDYRLFQDGYNNHGLPFRSWDRWVTSSFQPQLRFQPDQVSDIHLHLSHALAVLQIFLYCGYAHCLKIRILSSRHYICC